MLKVMRRHAKYFYVLFFIVILSFIFWGVGTVDKSGKDNLVAEVGPLKISGEEYWRAYDNAFKFYRDLYKEKFDEEMQNKLRLKERVLNSLVENKVLLAAAKDNGIKVSDEELNEAIKNEPAFMVNGAFDNYVYQNRLRLMRLTPESYEGVKRQELLTEKMKRLIELSVYIPESDLSGVSGDEQTVRALKMAMINSAKAKAVNAYVEGLKKGMKVKIYKDFIS